MKKNSLKLILPIVLFAFSVSSCKEKKSKENIETQTVDETIELPEETAITIEKLTGSPAYAEAVLQLDDPNTGLIENGSEVDFNFNVEAYELGAQTIGPNSNLLANSGKGQHIHFILNNQPYSAHYAPTFKKEIPNGVHHLVVFLSRSYHESVKNDNSVVVKKLEVGPNAEDTIGIDIAAPALIYSRPKGEYAGKDTENILLDFFVLNATLSENGNKVRATINGNQFLIAEWAPHILKGLPKGEITIRLELIDAEGNLIPGPFNEVTRTVMLKE